MKTDNTILTNKEMQPKWQVKDKGGMLVAGAKPRSLWDRMFLPEIIRGTLVTLRHLLVNLFAPKSKKYRETIKYPEEKRTHPKAYRGVHRLVLREDGSTRCVACFMCSDACPAYCIHIVAEESDDPDIEKRPREFIIDELRCVVCGLCVEACPEDAIRMDTGDHVPAVYKRREAVLHRIDLMENTGQDEEDSIRIKGAQDFRSHRIKR